MGSGSGASGNSGASGSSSGGIVIVGVASTRGSSSVGPVLSTSNSSV